MSKIRVTNLALALVLQQETCNRELFVYTLQFGFKDAEMLVSHRLLST